MTRCATARGQRMFYEGIYDSLFVLDEDGQVVPQLVTSFEYNEDSTQLTLDLDTSATFDDGTTLTAELVKQNLDARGTVDLSAYSGFAAGGENEISDVTVVDDDTVTLTFAAGPSPGSRRTSSCPAGRSSGRPAPPTAPPSTPTPDGSGPLTVDADATVKGNSYLLVKKEDNAAAADYPFDSYEFRPILDPQARVNAAISGEVDLASITADTQAQVESAGTGLVANGGTVQNIIAFDKNGALGAAVGGPARLPGAVDGDRPRDVRQRGAPGRDPDGERASRRQPRLPARARRGVRLRPRRAPRICSPRPATPTASTSTSRSTRAASATSRRCSPTGRRSAST